MTNCGCGHARSFHTGDDRGPTSCNGTAGDLDPADYPWGEGVGIDDPSLPCECTEYGEADNA